MLLIAASVVWRASITTRGYLTVDDFPIISQADAAGLRLGYLFDAVQQPPHAGRAAGHLGHRTG